MSGAADIADYDVREKTIAASFKALGMLADPHWITFFERDDSIVRIPRERRIRRIENFLHHPTSAEKAVEVMAMLYFCRKAFEWRQMHIIEAGGYSMADRYSIEYHEWLLDLVNAQVPPRHTGDALAKAIAAELARHGVLRCSAEEAEKLIARLV